MWLSWIMESDQLHAYSTAIAGTSGFHVPGNGTYAAPPNPPDSWNAANANQYGIYGTYTPSGAASDTAQPSNFAAQFVTVISGAAQQ
jgi:hypothetical protein